MYKYLFTVQIEEINEHTTYTIYAKNIASAVQKLKNLEQINEELVISIEIQIL